jgi:hypothetical protein
MKFMIEYSKKLEVKERVDILIIGGSQSGVAAAVSAKRTAPELRVMIIEQFGYLGGQSVGTMVCHFEFREYTNNAGTQLAKGIGKEMIERVIQKGNSDPLYADWLEGRGPPFKTADPRAMGDIPLDLEDLKLVYQEMCNEARVEVLLFSKLADVIGRKENGKMTPQYAIISDSQEIYAIEAKQFIDCTANNDIAWHLGEKFIDIPNQQAMPMQTYAWLGGIDIEKFVAEFWNHRGWWQLTYPDNKEQMIQHIHEGKTMMMRGGASYLDIAEEKYPGILEEIEKYCSPFIYYWLKPIKIIPIQTKNGTYFDSWWAIEGPYSFKPQTNPKEVSTFQQAQLLAVHLLRKVHSVLPGWEKCYIVRSSDRVGFRQTRVLKGEYRLTKEDVLTNARFDDTIGHASGHDISREKPEVEGGYDLPYRALIPRDIDNLLVAARSISCETEDTRLVALNAHRGISATIICSQAAGVAAALSIKDNVIPRLLNIKKLQSKLRNQNVIV